MYNQPASQRDFTSHTRSNSGQENQATEDLRNYAPIQEQFASSDASCARESNAHGRGALGLGSMGGRGEYNRERSGSLRQSPSDNSFHADLDAYHRGQSIGRTPSAASSRPSLDYAVQTQGSDTVPAPTQSMGGERTPLSRPPYSSQSSQYSRVNPTQYRGTHHPYQPMQGPWDESPYTQDSDPFLWSNRRNDGSSVGNYGPSPSPQPRTGRLGVPFHLQGPDPIHTSVAQFASEIKHISARVTSLVEAEEERTKTIERILGRLETIDTRLSALEDGLADINGVREKKVGGTLRGGSNSHLSLKPVVHSMFYEMCGVEMSGNKTQRTQELCAVKPLENGAAFEVVDGIETWHPVWDARVDHIINAQFLKSVVERIWNNEKNLRDTKGKGELDDADFSMSVIGDCAKVYFRNVHKQSDLLSKPEKLEKTRDKGRSRGRRQGRTKIRRQAAEEYCPGMGIPLDEAMAALDTDYASEAYTCASDDETSRELGDNQDERCNGEMAARREKSGLGVTAKMVVGPVWRNPDYTAFARWLTFKYYKGRELGNRSEPTGEPLRKRRRTTADVWKGFKKEFDPPVSKLSDRSPSTKATPFRAMMADWWLRDNPEFRTLERGGQWLEGFRTRLGKDDLHPLDWDHLDELVAWHNEKQRGAQRDIELVAGSSTQAM